jgi:hypothetical protein
MTSGNNNTNSTSEVDREIRQLFEDFILKAQKASVKEGKHYFPLLPESGVQSYYEAPRHQEHAYFSFIDSKDPAALTRSFQDLWKGLNNQEFVPMAPALSALAFKLQEVQGEQSTDLSPFIYTLY